MRILLIFCVTIFFVSCVVDSKNKENNSEKASKKEKMEPNSDLARKLYSQYYAEPNTQEERDQNDLLDYALDHNLDVSRTKTGLYYIIHQEGKGPFMQRAQPCRAHYTGYFLDGKIFDSSHKKGVPITFNVGQMVPGWNEALLLMNPGTKAQLLIPSRLAYGERGYPGLIPPNTPIIFDIEVLPF